MKEFSSWVFWFCIALAAGYAWAASAYLPRIDHLESQLRFYQIAPEPYDATDTAP